MAGNGGQNIEEILAQAKPKTVTVRVCLRGDLLAEHDELERQLVEARRLDESELRHAEAPHIAEQVQELERQIDAAAVPFTFTAIGQKAWSDLLAQYPPTDEDRAQRYEFNPKAFPQAAIAASASDPQISPEQAHKLYAALNFGQWQQLWSGCLDANVEGTSVPFSGAASVILRGSETKSDSHTL
jgi:hypothetical protein